MGVVERVTHDILQSWFGKQPHREERRKRQNEREVSNRASQILTHTSETALCCSSYFNRGYGGQKNTHLEWKSPDYELKISVSKNRMFVNLDYTLMSMVIRSET